jgi:hypothetical protein
MANKTNEKFPAPETDILLHDSLPPSRFSDPLSLKLRRSDLSGDELIISLSDSRENRRARQVFEWEIIRRNTVRDI